MNTYLVVLLSSVILIILINCTSFVECKGGRSGGSRSGGRSRGRGGRGSASGTSSGSSRGGQIYYGNRGSGRTTRNRVGGGWKDNKGPSFSYGLLTGYIIGSRIPYWTGDDYFVYSDYYRDKHMCFFVQETEKIENSSLAAMNKTINGSQVNFYFECMDGSKCCDRDCCSTGLTDWEILGIIFAAIFGMGLMSSYCVCMAASCCPQTDVPEKSPSAKGVSAKNQTNPPLNKSTKSIELITPTSIMSISQSTLNSQPKTQNYWKYPPAPSYQVPRDRVSPTGSQQPALPPPPLPPPPYSPSSTPDETPPKTPPYPLPNAPYPTD